MEQRGHFTKKLEELKMMVLRMAAMSEQAVHKSIRAMLENDGDLAEDVIVNDEDINELEVQVDKFTLELLALGQPMAIDLRTIVGALRVTGNLERLGDEAVNISHRALFLSTRPPLPYNQNMEMLADVSKTMLANSIKAFTEGDTELAQAVCVMDNKADALNMKILKTLINDMVTESRIVERGVHSIMTARHLERVADLSTNVAESVIFIVEGENVKHRCRE